MLNSISITPTSHDHVTSDQTMNWDPIGALNGTPADGNRVRTFLMKASSFLTELKRRKVYRVAAAYAVVSWLLIQAASIFLPTFDAPPCLMKLVVVFLALGFVVSAILSWVFDITPQGIRRTADVSRDQPVDIIRQLEAHAREEFIRGYLSALIYAGLGDKAKAIDHLEHEYLSHEYPKRYRVDGAGMSVDAMLHELRGDPRFAVLTEKPQ